jgi:MFS family permease
MLLFFPYVGIAIVAFPRFVYFELNGGEIGIGVAIAAFAIAAIAVRPFVGRLSDRYGRRALMASGALITAGAGVLASFAPNLPVFLAFRMMTDLGEAAIFVSEASGSATFCALNLFASCSSLGLLFCFGFFAAGFDLVAIVRVVVIAQWNN